jgi:hypothetical protein
MINWVRDPKPRISNGQRAALHTQPTKLAIHGPDSLIDSPLLNTLLCLIDHFSNSKNDDEFDDYNSNININDSKYINGIML